MKWKEMINFNVIRDSQPPMRINNIKLINMPKLGITEYRVLIIESPVSVSWAINPRCHSSLVQHLSQMMIDRSIRSVGSCPRPVPLAGLDGEYMIEVRCYTHIRGEPHHTTNWGIILTLIYQLNRRLHNHYILVLFESL